MSKEAPTMSGHSKWATIKHKKGAADKARGKLFAKLIRQVEVAAREGGGDPDSNPTLRTMFQKAREASVPMDTIERAIKRGTGELEGVRYEQVSYEGYAPSGVAVIVECLTDNRNRTGADIRSTFSKNGGSMAEPGAVSWQFERKGVILVPKSAGATEDDLMLAALEAGAEDITDAGEQWQVTTPPSDVGAVRAAIEAAGMLIESAEVTLLPTTTVSLQSESDAKKVLHVVDLLEEHDDVQNVYANFDIPDSILELVGA
jgi:YebC/PmpR family DNA-binding regulatory protein